MNVTPDTPFRQTSNTDRASFRAHLSRTQSGTPSPVEPEANAIYDVLLPLGLTRLGAAIAWIERSNETNPADLQYYGREIHNLFAVKNPPAEQATKGVWRRYPTYAAAAADWGPYILGPIYQDLVTIAELIGHYAPWSDGNNPDHYGRRAADLIDALPLREEESPVPDLVFKTLRPPAYDTRIVVKPWEGAGFDRVPPRNNVGMCMHKWWGTGDKYALYRLFSTGGERQADALVDWSITQEGEVVLLNEPWGTRAGWANGPANNLEGDGVQFVRQLGVGAVNGRLVSCEFEGRDEPLTAAQMQRGSDLWAYYYDQWEVPYTEYPMNPKVGLVTDLDHWEIGDKECPFAGARGQRSQFQDLVRGKLKAAQTQGGSTDPIPPVNPPQPDHSWIPDGMTEDVVEGLFGTLERVDMDGTVTNVGFDPKGVISNAWLARGAELKMYPQAQRWFKLKDGATTRNVVSFSSGWVLMGTDGDRGSWKWL